MFRRQVLVCMFLAAMCSTTRAAIPVGGILGDDNISLIYEPNTGGLRLDAAGKQITTLEIKSAAGYFTGTPPPGLVSPPFDVFTPTKYFLLKTAGIGDTILGNVLPPGLTSRQLAGDLTVTGSIKPSGGLGTVDLVGCPEPSSLFLFGLGGLGWVGGLRSPSRPR